MSPSEKVKYISNWIKSYVDQMPSKAQALVIGISGGIDSSVSSTLSAMTGLKTIVLTMPIKQIENQHDLSLKHQQWLVKNFKNVEAHTISLDKLFETGKIHHIMLDSEDLYTEVANDVDLFLNLKGRVYDNCMEYGVELLELYGVVFSGG